MVSWRKWGGGTAGQGAHLLRRMRAEHLQPRAPSTPLTPLLRYVHPWCTQRDACVRGHLRRIPYAFHVQISPKLVVPPVEGVAGEQLEWQSLSFGPFDHLQAQRDLGLKRALLWNPQLFAPLGRVGSK